MISWYRVFSVLEFLGWVFFFFFEIKGKVRFAAIGKKISNRDKSFAIDRTRTPRKKLLLRLKSRWLETKKDYKVCVHTCIACEGNLANIYEKKRIWYLCPFFRHLYHFFYHFYLTCFSFVLSMHVERDLVNIVKLFSFKRCRANSETRSKNNF